MGDEHLRNLPVPFYSQRKNEYIWYERYKSTDSEVIASPELEGKVKPNGKQVSMASNSCNITSVWMVLRYYGVPVSNPDVIMKSYFENTENLDFLESNPDAESVEKWKNIKDIIDVLYSSCSFTTALLSDVSIDTVKEEIKSGRPVIVSIELEKAKDGSGHIVVIRGFTKINNKEYIIINDPWGSPVGKDPYLVGEEGAEYWGGYYNKIWIEDSMGRNYSGDNAIIELSSFKKQMKGNEKFSTVLTIKKSGMWNFPDGSEDFSEYGKRLANIYDRIDYTNGSFPLTQNNTWHDGVHLNGLRDIHAIGVGRIAAMRNSMNPPLKGDTSFILLEHQEMIKNEVKIFYSLYMHLKPVDIKSEIQKYVLNGESAEYNWLNQLTRNLLPFKIIVSNLNKKKALGEDDQVEEQDGLLTGKFQKIEVFEAKYDRETNIFYKTDKKSNYKLGRRMLLHPLPANNSQLMKMLLSPEEYDKEYFFSNMKKEENYIKSIDGEKYFFFIYKGQVLCAGLNISYFESISFNSMEFKLAISRLNRLHKGETIFFNDEYQPEYLLDVNTSKESERVNWQVENKKNFKSLSANAEFSSNIVNTRESFMSKLDSLYFLGCQSLNESDLRKIEKAISEYTKDYTGEWEKLIEQQLKTYENKNKTKEGGTCTDAEPACNIIIKSCNSIIKSLNSIHREEKKLLPVDKSSGSKVISDFIKTINSFNSISKLEKISAYEFLLFKLFLYPAEKIAKSANGKNDCFTTNDSFYPPVINEIKKILGQVSNYLKSFSMKYIDTDIEIGKNEIIGKSGEYDNKTQIHFEILSNKDILSMSSDKVIEDTDKDSYFNPQKCVDTLTKAFENEGIKDKLKYIDDGIITNKELKELFNTGNNKPFLADYVFNHISQWSSEVKKAEVRKTGCIWKKEKFYIGDLIKDGKREKKYIDFDDYFDKYHKTYTWINKEFFKENKFNDGQVYVYHPLYFIEQISSKTESDGNAGNENPESAKETAVESIKFFDKDGKAISGNADIICKMQKDFIVSDITADLSFAVRFNTKGSKNFTLKFEEDSNNLHYSKAETAKKVKISGDEKLEFSARTNEEGVFDSKSITVNQISVGNISGNSYYASVIYNGKKYKSENKIVIRKVLKLNLFVMKGIDCSFLETLKNILIKNHTVLESRIVSEIDNKPYIFKPSGEINDFYRELGINPPSSAAKDETNVIIVKTVINTKQALIQWRMDKDDILSFAGYNILQSRNWFISAGIQCRGKNYALRKENLRILETDKYCCITLVKLVNIPQEISGHFIFKVKVMCIPKPAYLGGFSVNNSNVIAVSTNIAGMKRSNEQTASTVLHELSHSFDLVPDGYGFLDKSPSLKVSVGGNHCTDASCLMFESANGSTEFCENCSKDFRKILFTR